MEGHRRDGLVVVGGDARQRFHDARGYGRPRGGNEVALAPVEAAHLLFRGGLDAVDGEGFEAFLAAGGGRLGTRFPVYVDLRERGFYPSPARFLDLEGGEGIDFAVHARGESPPDGAVAYRVRAVGERDDVAAAGLGDVTLAIADEEAEVTYLETGRPTIEGGPPADPPPATAALLADRAVVWDPPAALYRRDFYGQPLGGRDRDPEGGPLGLSLVEGAHLAAEGVLDVEGAEDPTAAIRGRGRSVEGDRFDRRLAAYAALRSRGAVPKTGFKFGADFRVYREVASVEDLGHSEYLVRVLPADHSFSPRELALDVRLAGGVRKEMVFALVDDGVGWLSVARLTP